VNPAASEDNPKNQRKPSSPRRCVVEVMHPRYQPTQAELEEDVRINAPFEDVVQALTRPVELRYVKPDRPRR